MLKAPVQDLLARLQRREPFALSRIITLLESSRSADVQKAGALLDILPPPQNTFRVGFTGPPGVGKSTLIDALSVRHLSREDSDDLAVLAIDPSGVVNGGSLLGDKTRMNALVSHPRAYVRPSPSGGVLGGIAAATHESIRVCEAAGFGRIFVESVGVGQSEVALASVTDCAVLLLGPSLGDGLQAIKRGIMEVADIVVINKADEGTSLETAASKAATDARSSLSLLSHSQTPPRWPPNWKVPVIQVSAVTGRGLDKLLDTLNDYRERVGAAPPPPEWNPSLQSCKHDDRPLTLLEARRARQASEHLEASFVHLVRRMVATDPSLATLLEDARVKVLRGERSTRAAVEDVLSKVFSGLRGPAPAE